MAFYVKGGHSHHDLVDQYKMLVLGSMNSCSLDGISCNNCFLARSIAEKVEGHFKVDTDFVQESRPSVPVAVGNRTILSWEEGCCVAAGKSENDDTYGVLRAMIVQSTRQYPALRNLLTPRQYPARSFAIFSRHVIKAAISAHNLFFKSNLGVYEGFWFCVGYEFHA